MEFSLSSRSWFKLSIDFFVALCSPLIDRGAAQAFNSVSQHSGGASLSQLQRSASPQGIGQVQGGVVTFLRRPTRRLVRVIQVLDSSHPQGGSGRIRISGTMEEVCAELDRLVWQDRQCPASVQRLN
jgi:hypothetical protein